MFFRKHAGILLIMPFLLSWEHAYGCLHREEKFPTLDPFPEFELSFQGKGLVEGFVTRGTICYEYTIKHVKGFTIHSHHHYHHDYIL